MIARICLVDTLYWARGQCDCRTLFDPTRRNGYSWRKKNSQTQHTFKRVWKERVTSESIDKFDNCLICLRCLNRIKIYSPKWWLNGDLPWYQVKNHHKQTQVDSSQSCFRKIKFPNTFWPSMILIIFGSGCRFWPLNPRSHQYLDPAWYHLWRIVSEHVSIGDKSATLFSDRL